MVKKVVKKVADKKPVVKKKAPVKKPKVVHISERSFSTISNRFPVVGMNSPVGYSAPITKRKSGSYSARILKSQDSNLRTGQVSTSWEYFEFDETGLITSTPRGFAKEFKNVRIIDIEEYRIKLDPRENKEKK